MLVLCPDRSVPAHFTTQTRHNSLDHQVPSRPCLFAAQAIMSTMIYLQTKTHTDGCARVVVVVPANVLDNWMDELEFWFAHFSAAPGRKVARVAEGRRAGGAPGQAARDVFESVEVVRFHLVLSDMLCACCQCFAMLAVQNRSGGKPRV